MGIEFELKFRATPESLEAIRKTAIGEEKHYRMETTYYDTRSGALSKRYYTLRHRMENDDSVCTLKTPAQGEGRNEIELSYPNIEDALPELCKLSNIPELPSLLEEGIVTVCGAKFTRIAKTVELADATVELALDRGVLTGGGRELPLCEIEVELKSGSRKACSAYAMQLAVAFGLEQEQSSKFRRALALAEGE